MGTRDIIVGWASRHGYDVIHEGSAEPNLVIVGERHGIYAYGHVPEFLEAQAKLIREARPTDIALEAVEMEGLYSMDTDFGDMHGYFMSSTVVDLHKMVSGLEYKGKLENNTLRRKIAGLIFNWPENLYRREAESIGAEVHLIDNEKLHEDQERRAESVGHMDLEGQLIAGMRSYFMQIPLASLQRARPLTLAIMGAAHMEDIISFISMRADSVGESIYPRSDPKFNIDPERMIAINMGDYDGPGTEDNSRALGKLMLEGIADILEVEKDMDRF